MQEKCLFASFLPQKYCPLGSSCLEVLPSLSPSPLQKEITNMTMAQGSTAPDQPPCPAGQHSSPTAVHSSQDCSRWLPWLTHPASTPGLQLPLFTPCTSQSLPERRGHPWTMPPTCCSARWPCLHPGNSHWPPHSSSDCISCHFSWKV